MDIHSPKKSQLVYKRGDEKTQGVIDLRRFGAQKNTPEKTKKLFYEVKPAQRKNMPQFLESEKKTHINLSKNDTIKIRINAQKSTEEEQNNIEDKKKENLRKNNTAISAFSSTSSVSSPSRPKLTMPDMSFFFFRRQTSIMPQMEKPGTHRKKAMMRFAISSFMIPIIISSFSFVQIQFEQKGRVLGESTTAYEDLKSAAQYAFASDFTNTGNKFDSASMNFSQAQASINGIGNGIGEVIGILPINTPVSTAHNLAAAGENVSLAGKEISVMMEKIKRQIQDGGNDKLSLTALAGLDENLIKIATYLKTADENMQKVDTRYIPEEMRSKIELAKQTLPTVSHNMQRLSEDYPSIIKILGGQRPQKYLLLFENNTEMRATGGFIGSYGILDIENGQIQNLTIDGIFNPDGQLREKIVPPMPIQKISASWSMHDSNWFADFPVSAKKTALFYEKTGGQTVDGVIAITPETVKKLLEIVGPVEMPAYGVTITTENFIAETQSQVEDLYDKKENKPKKILSDLAPILIDKLFRDKSLTQETKIERLLGVVQKIEESLREKHILVYHRDDSIEQMIQKRGWGGEVIQNQNGDYLAVINSNINGYKTDAVIEENINLETEISEDGTIIDTLTIRRKHNGGNEQYDWYNRVNADYLRVYVPKGSMLLEAAGNTIEEYIPPMDYSSFETDPDVSATEKTIKIDPDSKTQVFEETGKTVFGNWVYVSPQEEVTLTYKYQLPFKIDFKDFKDAADAYSAIIQKQAGSLGSSFTATIKFPQSWQPVWHTDNLKDGTSLSEKLTKDMIYGQIFTRN